MVSADTAKEKRSDTEVAFMQALNRIKTGLPWHDRNVALAKRGGLRVTIATVAREAGRSRTLIGSENCRYPKVREAVLAAMHNAFQGERRPSAADLVKILRADKATLERHVSILATRLHDASLHVWELEKRCGRLELELAQARVQLGKKSSLAKLKLT